VPARFLERLADPPQPIHGRIRYRRNLWVLQLRVLLQPPSRCRTRTGARDPSRSGFPHSV